jgi:adenylate cyclase
LLGSLALAVVYSLLVLTAFVQAGSVFPIWTSLMAAALGWVSGAASRLLLVEGQRQKVSKLLDRMVSRQVAEAVQGGSLERAERRQITLLFSDINGFTPTCERESPERVLAMLNRYFQEMVSLIDRHGGYVKQFVGDEIMAIYGAPKPTASHPRDAVLTAIAMLERLSALQAADPEGGGFYSAKIGINTGEAVLGSVGADERWEYAAVGDDVNLAARLESLTTKLGVDILVSKFTRDLVDQLPQGWSWKSLGVQQFKGKNSQLEVFTLVKE